MLDSICGSEQIKKLKELLPQITNLEGEVWECGVYGGGSASIILENISENRILRLFDTFGPGIPFRGELDGNCIGGFSINENIFSNIKKYFKAHSNVKLHVGKIPTTFELLKLKKICFAHIDVDQEQAYNDCLNFIWPKLVPGGIMVFDDYGAGSCDGATRAVKEFIAKNNIELNLTPNYGAWIRKPSE
jgi:O-methyltransferase